MWEILYGLGALILAGAIAYGIYQSSRRKKFVEPVTEQATREQYQHPERYSPEAEEHLRAEAKRRA